MVICTPQKMFACTVYSYICICVEYTMRKKNTSYMIYLKVKYNIIFYLSLKTYFFQTEGKNYARLLLLHIIIVTHTHTPPHTHTHIYIYYIMYIVIILWLYVL